MAPSSDDSGASAFSRSRRTLHADQACPCGRGRFGTCCGPILAGEPAEAAEALMRSRFTAFALADRRHLEATWHPSTFPGALELVPSHRWSDLSIDEVIDGAAGDRRGVVAFRASWRDTRTGESGVMRERSRFLHQRGRWWYLDGDVG